MPYAILGFLVHAAAYMIVTIGLVAINLVLWNGYFWAVWPMLGWGIGVFSHGRATFRTLWTQAPASGLSWPGDPSVGRMESGSVTIPDDEWKRVTRRLENLEAIVTSEEWNGEQGM